MKKMALVLAAVMASGMIMSACGGGSTTTPTTATTTAATGETKAGETAAPAEGTGKTGLDLAVQIGPDPETLDPALNSAIDGANMIVHAFETLLIVNKDNVIVPGQAESFEVSEDGLTYTFHLRKDLKWSDGSPLTANDFVYTWKRFANPETAAPYAFDMLGAIKGYDEAAKGTLDALAVSAPDDNTFVVELAAPCVYFDKLVTHGSTSPVQQASVEANGDQWTLTPDTYVSNGALKMTEWVPGSHIIMSKNENYWNADAVTVNSVKFVLMEDSNAAYSAYKSGELSMIKDVPAQEVPSLKGSDEFHLDPLMGTYYLSFMTKKAPFDNVDVRMALSLAIDRDYVANTVMQGTYMPATNFVGPGISDADDGSVYEDVTRANNGGKDFFNIGDHDVDLAKAKELLAKAGYPDGQGFPTIEYMTNDLAYHKPVAEYLQSAFKEIGVNMDIKIVEWSTFTPTRRNGDFQMARNGWVYDYDDPSNMLNLMMSSSGNNDGKYNNPAVDALLKEANATADKAEHYKKLHEAEMLVLNDAAMMPVAYYTDFYLQDTKLQGTWHSPYGYWYFMYATMAE